MKKKLIAILSIVLVVGIIISIVCVCLVKKKDSDKTYTNEEIAEEILEVDEKINDFLSSEEYANIDAIEEKKEAVEDMLLDLSEDGLIAEDSIDYHEDNKQFSFAYTSGISSGVYLDLSFDNGLAGSAVSGSNVALSSNNYVTSSSTMQPTISDSIMLYGWNNIGSSRYANWEDIAEKCNQTGMDMTISTTTTVEDYKTILLDKDFICIAEHGCNFYSTNSNDNVFTFCVYGDKVTFNNIVSYAEDVINERIYIIHNVDVGDIKNSSFFLISPKFIEHYYANKFNNSIVYLSSCMGFGVNGDLDYEFAEAFCDVGGAYATIGFHNSVWLDYTEGIIEQVTTNYMQGCTLEESLNKATSFYGSDDKEYVETFGGLPEYTKEKPDPPAFPILYRTEYPISCQVFDAVTMSPIADVMIEIVDNAYEGYAFVDIPITDENGEFSSELPYGNYSISFHHDNYEFYGTSFSVDGDNSSFNEPILLTPKEDDTNDTPSSAEDDLKALAESYGIVSAWEYADYDGNGTKEAFAVITSENSVVLKTLYVSSDGTVTIMEDNLNLMFSPSVDGNIKFKEGKGFFYADMMPGNYYSTVLYSVKNNVPYVLNLSGDIEGFAQSGDVFYTYEVTFASGGRGYDTRELIYNPSTQEFTKGNIIEIEDAF